MRWAQRCNSGSVPNGARRRASSPCARASSLLIRTCRRQAFPGRSDSTSSGSDGTRVTRALLITNPFAARADARAVTAILRILGRGGWNVDLRTTTGPGDARRIAEQARDEGFDVLVRHGGGGGGVPDGGGSRGRRAPA